MTVPVGSELEFGLVIDGGGGGLIVIDKAFVSDCGIASVTCTVKENVPVAVAVPEIWPVDAVRLKPFGRAPIITPQVRGAMPPVTCRV